MKALKRDLILATNNRHKFEEISSMLRDAPVRLIPLWEISEPPDLKEEGSTYAENAAQKALMVVRQTGKWALGDDTGLEVEALGGEPGLYSARYAGEGVTFAQNRSKLLAAMKPFGPGQRGAVFRTVLALAGPSGEPKVVEGLLYGEISMEEKGGGGFGYDPIFLIPETGKTYAELSAREKNRISHRARAVEKLRPLLEEIPLETGRP